MSAANRFCFRGGEILVRDAGGRDAGGQPATAAGSQVAGLTAGMPPANPPAAPVPESAADLESSAALMAGPADRLVFPGDGTAAELYPADFPAPGGWAWLPFRSVIGALPDGQWSAAAKAMAFINWRTATRFCGRCGAPNGDKSDELARVCTGCGALSFPRISPAVLAVVKKDNRLLLARNVANKTGVWSLLAGFVEPGETL